MLRHVYWQLSLAKLLYILLVLLTFYIPERGSVTASVMHVCAACQQNQLDFVPNRINWTLYTNNVHYFYHYYINIQCRYY